MFTDKELWQAESTFFHPIGQNLRQTFNREKDLFSTARGMKITLENSKLLLLPLAKIPRVTCVRWLASPWRRDRNPKAAADHRLIPKLSNMAPVKWR